MSRKGDILRQRALFSARLRTREARPLRFNALMGDGTGGDPRTPNRPNYVYVRVEGRGVVEEVMNVRVVARNDLPVIVGFDTVLPDVLQVLSLDPFFVAALESYVYGVAPHHQTHELLNEDGGDDVVWVQSQQFLPLLCYPSDPVAMTVEVFQGWYPWISSWHYFEAATSPNLAGSVPALGQAIYILISIDGATETLQTTAGAPFAEFLPPPDMENQVPAAPLGSIPIAAIYLVNGQTTINWDSIYDLRLFGQPVGGSVTPAAHDLLSAQHSDTDPQAVTQGSLVVGDATPEWTELVVGIAHAVLKMNGAGTDPVWAAFDWDDIAAAVAADMVHDHSAALEGGQLDWDVVWADAVHDHSAAGEGGEVPLASLGDYTQGDLIIGGAADWEDLAIGAALEILRTNAAGTEPEWAAVNDPAFGRWEALTDGDPVNPELVFTALADVIMVWVP